MTDEELFSISESYGTPTFVFDTQKLSQRMRAISNITGPAVNLCYSIKANPFLIPAMLPLIEKLEVCSPGELEICKTLGVDPKKIVYSGVNKTLSDVEDAMQFGSGIFTAESLLHVSLINQVAVARGEKVPLLLRLTSGNQFGMSESDLRSVIQNRDSYNGIEIKGIHYFAGTQRKKLQQQKDELQMLHDFYNSIEKDYGFTLENLEYGSGLPVPYFEGEDFEHSLQPLETLNDALQEAAKWACLTVEMGRFFVSDCGFYLTKVMDQKTYEDLRYCILDGGINHLNYYGQMMGMKIPSIRHLKPVAPESSCAENIGNRGVSLFGSLCTTADVIAKNVPLSCLENGDVLAFENTGAYSVTEGIALFLSRTMPRIILYYGKDDIRLARDFIESSAFNTVAKCAR